MYMYAVLDFQEKSWGQLAPKFSFVVTKAFRQIVRGFGQTIRTFGQNVRALEKPLAIR